MTSPLYTFTVPTFIKGLKNLSHILKKGEEYATENNIPLSDLVNAAIYPDMKPLPFQVQTASNTAKNSLVRLAGSEPVPMEDNETTVEELQTRIAKTIELLEAADAAAFAGEEDKELVVKLGPNEVTFTRQSYVTEFALPNFYFHLNMAYAILRMKGVPLAKWDYLKNFDIKI